MKQSVSAGFGADAQNRVIDYRPTVIASDAEAAETIFVRVCGDSMHPQIQDGDLVQVRKQETAETGDIVVVLDGSEAFVKRFIHGKNGVVLESANPAYPPRKYSRSCGQNEWCGSEQIKPLTYAEAQEWAEKYLDGEDYCEIFGEPSEDEDDVALNLMISAAASAKLKKAAAQNGISLRAQVERWITEGK